MIPLAPGLDTSTGETTGEVVGKVQAPAGRPSVLAARGGDEPRDSLRNLARAARRYRAARVDLIRLVDDARAAGATNLEIAEALIPTRKDSR